MERESEKKKQGPRAAKKKKKKYTERISYPWNGVDLPQNRILFPFAVHKADAKLLALIWNKCLIKQRDWGRLQIFSSCVLAYYTQTRTACCIQCTWALSTRNTAASARRSTNKSNTQIWTNSRTKTCLQPQKAQSSFVLRKQFWQTIIVIIIPLFCVVHSSSDQSQPENSTFFFYLFVSLTVCLFVMQLENCASSSWVLKYDRGHEGVLVNNHIGVKIHHGICRKHALTAINKCGSVEVLQ